MGIQHPCAKTCEEVVVPRVLPLLCFAEHLFPGHQLPKYALKSGGGFATSKQDEKIYKHAVGMRGAGAKLVCPIFLELIYFMSHKWKFLATGVY